MKKAILGILCLASCAAGAMAGEGESGKASWYGPGHIGRKTASGEIFTGRERTAAHRDLPLGALVRVRALSTGRSVVVRINDRGPYVEGRVIDLSERAARDLGIVRQGTGDVTLEVLALGAEPE